LGLLLLGTEFRVVQRKDVVADLIDLLGVTVIWQLLAQFSEESLDPVWSMTSIESFTNLLA